MRLYQIGNMRTLGDMPEEIRCITEDSGDAPKIDLDKHVVYGRSTHVKDDFDLAVARRPSP